MSKSEEINVNAFEVISVVRDPTHMVFNQDHTVLYVVNAWGEMSIVQIRGYAVTPLDLYSGVLDFVMGSDKYAYFCSANRGALSRFDTDTKNVSVVKESLGSKPYGIAVSAGDAHIYTGIESANKVVVVKPGEDDVRDINFESAPIGLGITTDGTKLYVCHPYANKVSVVNIESNEVVGDIDVEGVLRRLVVSALNKVYTISVVKNLLSVIDVGGNEVVRTVPLSAEPFCMAVSTDGKYVCVGLFNKAVVINTSTYESAEVSFNGIADAIAISTDSMRLYVAHRQWDAGKVSVFELPSK